MATKRAAEEVQELCKILMNDRDSPDAVLDVLRRLKSLPLPLSVVKACKLEQKLRPLKRDDDDEIRRLATALLTKIANASRQEKPLQVLPPRDDMRKRVCKLLEGTFKAEKDTQAGVISSLCVAIEEAMFQGNGKDAKSKQYKAKFRTLKFNLSKNAELRQDLIKERLSAARLVAMNAAELASSEKRRQRKEEQDNIFKASRSDWLDANRDSINKQAGIKATGGLYKCFNCKSTKTTHYQKQTRSADEPMTVFVQCTNCGKRWRC